MKSLSSSTILLFVGCFLTLNILFASSKKSHQHQATTKSDKTKEKGEQQKQQQDNQILASRSLKELQKLSTLSPVISLDTKTFNKFVVNGPRQYAVIVFFTSETDMFDCPTCMMLPPVIEEVASSYKEHIDGNYSRATLFFVKAELSKCQEIYQKMQSNIPQLPLVVFIANTEKKKSIQWSQNDIFPITYTMSAASLAQWVSYKTNIEIPYQTSHSEKYWGALIIVVMLYMVTRKLHIFIDNYRQPMMWFSLSAVACALVLAGTVYNAIHNPPFLWQDPQGRILWIYPATRSQFVLEGLIVVALFAAGSTGIILAANYLPTIKNQAAARRNFVVFAFMIMTSYYFVMKIFRSKMPDYPF